MVALVGNSRGALVEAVARAIGNATMGTPSNPLKTTAISPNNLTLKLAGLADSEARPSKYGGQYAYLRDGVYAGQQMRISRTGFNGSTGDVTLATPYNTSGGVMVQANTQVAILGTMPWIAQDGLQGMADCLDVGIRKYWIEREYPIVSVADDETTYDLGALWWARRDRFLQLLDPHPDGVSAAIMAKQSWDVVANGENWYLQLASGYPAGSTFWLKVLSPLNSRMYKTGAWAEQASPTAGLVLDADAVLGEWSNLYEILLYEVFCQMAIQAGGARKSYWNNRRLEQKSIVAIIKNFYMEGPEAGLASAGPTVGPGSWADAWGTKGLFVG